MRLIDADELKEVMCRSAVDTRKKIENIIDNAPTVNIIQFKDWYLVNKAGAKELLDRERPQGECTSCRYRDPEDKKCDCGGLERQGCKFPVNDDYYCKYYEKGGAE